MAYNGHGITRSPSAKAPLDTVLLNSLITGPAKGRTIGLRVQNEGALPIKTTRRIRVLLAHLVPTSELGRR